MILEYSKLFFKNLLDITLEMSPWLLLGFMFAGLLKVFVNQSLFHKHLGKNNLISVIKSAIFGVPMPLCSCGVIPTSVGMYKQGASTSAVSSFLISTPQTGVDSILATYALLGLPFAILRPIIAFCSGIIGGVIDIIFNSQVNKNKHIDYTEVENYSEYSFIIKLKHLFNYAFYEMIMDIAKWLIIGLVLASIVSTFIPLSFFQNYLSNPFLEMIVILLLSIPLYVCATGSIPLAYSFFLKGISPGSIIVFLMAGPATNIATITVLSRSIGKRFTYLYTISIIISSITFGILTNIFVGREIFIKYMNFYNHFHEHYTFFSYFFTLILFGLVMNVYFFKKKFNFANNIESNNMTEYKVIGMSCNHCVNNVEKTVSQIDGVKNVLVDLESGTMKIYGDVSFEIIKENIESIGYSIEKQ